MKLEDLLMQPSEEKQIKQLQQEVKKLQHELDEELQLKRVMQCAMQGPLGCCESCSHLSSFLPHKVQMLLAELAVVEDEVGWLERQITQLKLGVYQEKQHIKEWELLQLKGGTQPQWELRQIKKLSSRRPNQIQQDDHDPFSKSQNFEQRKYTRSGGRRASVGSSIELHTTISTGTNGKEQEDRGTKIRTYSRIDTENEIADPNKLSVDLIKCLTSIFLNLNKTCKNKASNNVPKKTIMHMKSKGLVSKSTFSCSTPIFPFSNSSYHLDPFGILPEAEITVRDVGPYQNFIQLTRSSLDPNRLSDCFPAMKKLRVLMQRLSRVNITHFNHKQKLAFWINVYNACVMHAFLQHGLPSTHEKLLMLMNEATINVGETELNVFTIEHSILRHPTEVKNELIDEKAMVLRHTCGIDYPEPNVTFALCRGSWSSPALRFYTPEEVMNELEIAKVEYLEASVGITSKKRILVPKLMQWHMKDFADDMESLLEWIYSQLPYNSSLKRLIMECIKGDTQCVSQKLIQIQPYVSEFRYLLPS